MSKKSFHPWIRSIGLVGIPIALAVLAWVQWQGVKVERNKVALEAYKIVPNAGYRVHMQQFLGVGFSISEVLESLYEMRGLNQEAVELWGGDVKVP